MTESVISLSLAGKLWLVLALFWGHIKVLTHSVYPYVASALNGLSKGAR